MQYTIEIVKNGSYVPQVLTVKDVALDKIRDMLDANYKSNYTINLLDNQGDDIAYREFGTWHIAV